MANLEPLMSSGRTGELWKDEWRTPLWLFEKLNKEFSFTLDAAATDQNALCNEYFTREEDALKQEWDGSVFVNPPYSQMRKWVEKAYNEAYKGNTEIVVILVAARTDTKAWWDYIRKGQVRFLPGRLKFGVPPELIYRQKVQAEIRALKGKASRVFETTSAPFPSAIAIFHSKIGESSTMYWEVREEK